MKRTIAGREASPIGLGCMGLSHGYGTPPSPEDAAKVLHRALDLGYDHLDTARLYGAGRNEELLGRVLKERRGEYFLASKTGIIIDGPRRYTDCSPDVVRREVEISLTALKTDHIDLYYLHRFDPKVPIADSVGALADLIGEGKIGGYGVSEWSAAHIREAHAVHPMAAVQTEYSLWTRNVEIAVLETCRELGIALVAFSPVARGVLTGAFKDPSVLREGDVRYPHPRFNAENWPKNRALADRFDAIAAREGLTPAQLALAWLLSRGPHVHAIPGTTDLAHLEENFRTLEVTVADSVLAEAGALINQGTVAGHRYHEPMRKTIDTEDFPAN